MSVQFDAIGDHYTCIKETPGSLLELHTLRTSLGDITDQSVLDLACGSGFYAQKAMQWGARSVTGVDISRVMLDDASRRLSCSRDEWDPQLQLYQIDCGQAFDLGQRFDVVLAVWLLNYASTRAEMVTMWMNIARHLKPGGRCLGIVPNFDMLGYGDKVFPGALEWGYKIGVVGKVEEGVKLRVEADVEPAFGFNCFEMQRQVYEECARMAGCVVQWLPMVDPVDERVNFASILPRAASRVFWATRDDKDLVGA
ncbi:S-adenosyl-L-methionine-dependent methyltransferase [Aspergillus steynii IBT 23096]|uniref:S-adenosyl-L-methionine-dependent methyltransferase n=1 Tax=Aspergillus steynii IBT 23096 TaxID=1392250 RepID=A0A2I2FYR9_9EURO|nr:S-adenosyl-L-methionine-dependent methyltransferase [Aspergillus steynii IBT 23096]PLB45784.1 S-adenosyl-L-methionine-dependent methyltransferase [Aspergillus steynii IBT 23096]